MNARRDLSDAARGGGGDSTLAADGIEVDWSSERSRGPGPGEEAAPAIFAGYESGRVVGWEVGSEVTPVADLLGHQRAIAGLRCRRRLPGNCEDPTAVCLITASHDGTVCVWSLPLANGLLGGHCLFQLDFGPRNPVADFMLLPGNGLLAASWDGRLRHVDLGSRRCVSMFQGCSTSLRSVCAAVGSSAGDGMQVYIGSDDAHITSLSFTQYGDFEKIGQWKAHNSQVTSLKAWKSWLISASDDRTIRVWMPTRSTACAAVLLEQFRGHAGAVLAISISDTDRLLWSGAQDWTIRSWDLREVESRVWEQGRMAEMDAESLEEELQQRLAAKAAKKQRKPKKAASAGPGKSGRKR